MNQDSHNHLFKSSATDTGNQNEQYAQPVLQFNTCKIEESSTTTDISSNVGLRNFANDLANIEEQNSVEQSSGMSYIESEHKTHQKNVERYASDIGVRDLAGHVETLLTRTLELTEATFLKTKLDEAAEDEVTFKAQRAIDSSGYFEAQIPEKMLMCGVDETVIHCALNIDEMFVEDDTTNSETKLVLEGTECRETLTDTGEELKKIVKDVILKEDTEIVQYQTSGADADKSMDADVQVGISDKEGDDAPSKSGNSIPQKSASNINEIHENTPMTPVLDRVQNMMASDEEILQVFSQSSLESMPVLYEDNTQPSRITTCMSSSSGILYPNIAKPMLAVDEEVSFKVSQIYEATSGPDLNEDHPMNEQEITRIQPDTEDSVSPAISNLTCRFNEEVGQFIYFEFLLN